MVKKIKMWAELITGKDIIEQLAQAANQTRGSILAVLSELDEVIL